MHRESNNLNLHHAPYPGPGNGYHPRYHTDPTALLIAITKSSLLQSCCHSTTGCAYRDNTRHR